MIKSEIFFATTAVGDILRNRGRVSTLSDCSAHLFSLVDLLQEVFRRLKMRQIRDDATLEERSSLDEQRDVAIVHLLGLVETTLLGGPQECLSKVEHDGEFFCYATDVLPSAKA